MTPGERAPGSQRRRGSRAWCRATAMLVWLLPVLLAGCDGGEGGEPVSVVVPRGASLNRVTDTLAARGVIGERSKLLFRLYGRVSRADRDIRAGHYEFLPGQSWSQILSDLTSGRGITVRLTVPEGFTLARMAPRIAAVAGVPPDSAERALFAADSLAARFQVPGPGLEGYLFPDTYHFEPGTELEDVIAAMILRYQSFWTPERRERLEELGMTEGEVVTLASIIEAEALWTREMPVISSVYHNRLRIGQALYADPTVLYALGGTRERLLYAAIDSVADNPYNTYRHPGLPPGPIGSPGADAIDAALNPAETTYYYFVARPDGTHVFTRSLDEHNLAKVQARREWDTARAAVRAPSPELDDALPAPDGDPP